MTHGTEPDVRAQLEMLQKIFDHVPLMLNLIDVHGRVLLINREWERTLGWTFDEIRAGAVDILVAAYPDPVYRQHVLDFVADPRGEWREFRTRVRDGRVIDTAWALVRLSDGTLIGIGRDVTEHKRTRQALARFSRRLVEVQEAERRLIARELHDEVGQMLTGLTLLLESSARAPAEAIKGLIAEAQHVADDLLARVRAMSLDLRPAPLDDLGLLAALLWHFERYTASTGVRVSFGHDGLAQRRFDPDVETAAYRIAQEALTNVARHSRAREAIVWASADDRVLCLEVEDAGSGFDPEMTLNGPRTAGVLGMRERARLLQGRFIIHSAPGAGTRLRVELPLRRSDDEGLR